MEERLMERDKLFGKTTRAINVFTKMLCLVSAAAMSIMTLVIVANVVGRYFFKKPLAGSIELIQMLAVVVVFFGVAYTEFRRGHVGVELLTAALSRPIQAILASIMCFLSAIYFAIMAWRCAVLAQEYLFPVFRKTDVLLIPFTPFIFVTALGSAALVLETLIHVFRPLPDEEEIKEKETK
jgi:TRAP-type transport system small permease protein